MMHLMEHAFFHALEELVRLLPFLFLTYLVMEYMEKKAGERTEEILYRTGKAGPIIGGILGVIPQCGFSAAAANFYAGGVITVGTMTAVFLSTSDEMLPILISGKAEGNEIVMILAAKVIVAIAAGIAVDVCVRRMNDGKQKGLHIQELCERERCHCEEGGVIKPALIHCLKIGVYIMIIIFGIHFVSHMIGMEQIVKAAGSYPVISIFLVALLGLIPNCAISVAITTFYLEGILSAGSMFAGLLACSGIGLIVLFRTNANGKKNMIITAGIYLISVVSGLIVEVLL